MSNVKWTRDYNINETEPSEFTILCERCGARTGGYLESVSINGDVTVRSSFRVDIVCKYCNHAEPVFFLWHNEPGTLIVGDDVRRCGNRIPDNE